MLVLQFPFSSPSQRLRRDLLKHLLMRILPWDTKLGREKGLVSTHLSFAKSWGSEGFAGHCHPSWAFTSWMKIMIFIWGAYYALLLHIQTSLNGYFLQLPMGKIGHVKVPGIQLSFPTRDKKERKITSHTLRQLVNALIAKSVWCFVYTLGFGASPVLQSLGTHDACQDHRPIWNSLCGQMKEIEWGETPLC